MKKNYFLIMIVLGFFSCQKELSKKVSDTEISNINAKGPNTNNSQQVDVYVLGTEAKWRVRPTYALESAVAKYWKNGQAVSLADGTEAEVTSIAVVGGDVYVAGSKLEYTGSDYNNGYTSVARYWKNRQVVSLTDGTKEAFASSIAVIGNDVYVGGVEYDNKTRQSVAKYWKNGQAVSLTDGTNDAQATSIAVAGGDVYVAGYEYKSDGGSVAKYWKNGQAVALTDGTTRAAANCITVVGNDVYIAGFENIPFGNNVAKYWKNGNPVALTDGTSEAMARSIVVEGSDVYVAGYPENIYWKNGQAITITDGFASSIAAMGSDVYLAGNKFFWATAYAALAYWKNGQATAITDGSTIAIAKSMTIVKR